MDWLKSSLQAAQKQAQEAAEKAKVLAQQASQQARVYAEQASEQAKAFAGQASEQAKVFAEQASEKAKVLASAAAEEAQAKLQQFAAATAQPGGASSSLAADLDPAELAKYGVTPGLLETISGMTYSTFSDYPLELLPTTNPWALADPIPSPGFRLNPWQERHALLVLSRGDQLQGLRFALCPKRMSEELFWIIYFTLVKTLLPPEAFKAVSAESVEESSSGAVAAAAGAGPTPSSSASARAAAAPSDHVSAPSSSKRLADDASSAPARTAGGSGASTGATTPRDAGGGRSSVVGDEAVLVDVGSSSNGGDDEGDDNDDDDDDNDDADAGEGGDADLDALDDDPELAAYLQEALDVGDVGDGEGLSDLGSATDDLDDYINQLDAELGAEGGGGEVEESPAKPVYPIAH